MNNDLQDWIKQKFDEKHPPKYTGFYQFDKKDVEILSEKDGKTGFVINAKEMQGGFIGNILKGNVQFKGEADQAKGEIWFEQVHS
jgi:hypothetical protein